MNLDYIKHCRLLGYVVFLLVVSAAMFLIWTDPPYVEKHHITGQCIAVHDMFDRYTCDNLPKRHVTVWTNGTKK